MAEYVQENNNNKPSWLKKPDIIEVLEKFHKCFESERDQREKAVEDLLFVDAEDGQWDDYAKNARSKRPRYTIDRITPAIEQVEGNQQQTEIGVRVFPRRDGKEEVAEVFNGLIRDIQNESAADTVYDDSYLEMLKGGYGGWQVKIKWRSGTFDQICCIERIESAVTSLFFGPSSSYTREDAEYAFVVREYPMDEYKEKWPDAGVVDFTNDSLTFARNTGWFPEERVRVAEFWEKIPYKREIALMSDGRVLDVEDEKDVMDELADAGITVVRTREEEASHIQMTICNGAEILDGPQPWVGEYIPLIPEFGRYSNVAGYRYVRGMVRKAKDPQRIFNYTESNTVETTALTPKDPYLVTPTMIAKSQRDWQEFTTRHIPVLKFEFDEKNPNFIPTRGGAPQLQQALIQQSMASADNIKTVLGIHDPSLGNAPQRMSGVAIGKEQDMGDRGSFRYQKNHLKSIEHTGKVLVDLIQKIYDGERIERILGPDGKTEEIKINQTVIDEETGKEVIVNDLSLGSYGVVAKAGPTSPTKRRETTEQLITLSEKAPIISELALDLIVDNLDINQGDEIHKRVRKKMITEGKVDPTEEEIKEMGLDQQKPDPMQEALVSNIKAQTEQLQVSTQELIAKIENTEAKTQQSIMDTQQAAVDSFVKISEMITEKLEKGIPIADEELEAVLGQSAILEETQEDVLENQQIAGSLPMDVKPLARKAGQNLPPGSVPGQGIPTGPTGPSGPNPGPQLPGNMADAEPISGQNTPI